MAKSCVLLLALLSLLPATATARSNTKAPALRAVDIPPPGPVRETTRRQAANHGAVILSRRLGGGPLCFGVCPTFDLYLWPDNRVTVVQYNISGDGEAELAGTKVGILSTKKIRNFVVSPRRADRFRKLLAVWRPKGEVAIQDRCDAVRRALPPSESIYPEHEDHPVQEVEIRWLPDGHVIGCSDDGPLYNAFSEAVRALGLYPDANPRP